VGFSLGGFGVGASVSVEDLTTQVLVTLLRADWGDTGGPQAMALSEALEAERC